MTTPSIYIYILCKMHIFIFLGYLLIKLCVSVNSNTCLCKAIPGKSYLETPAKEAGYCNSRLGVKSSRYLSYREHQIPTFFYPRCSNQNKIWVNYLLRYRLNVIFSFRCFWFHKSYAITVSWKGLGYAVNSFQTQGCMMILNRGKHTF